MNLHRQVEIETNGFRYRVDEGMAELVIALNEAGYRTVSSCECFPPAHNQAYVGFLSLMQARRFCELIDGEMMIPIEADRLAAIAAGADPDDPSTNAEAAVLFDPERIEESVSAVLGRAGV